MTTSLLTKRGFRDISFLFLEKWCLCCLLKCITLTSVFSFFFFLYQIVLSPHLCQDSGESSDFLKVMTFRSCASKDSASQVCLSCWFFFYSIAFICSDDILGDRSASRDFLKFSLLCVNISIASLESRWVVPSYLVGENSSDFSFNVWSDFYFRSKNDDFSIGNGIK